jgi:integrase/recombinase XerD
MTHLRKMMLEELERRNWAQTTLDSYLRATAEVSLLFHRPPNQLGPKHIRQCQAHVFGRRKLAPISKSMGFTPCDPDEQSITRWCS